MLISPHPLAKYTRYDEKGATEVDIPEPGETPDVADTVGAMLPTAQLSIVGSAAELIDEFSDENGMLVHEVNIGARKFHIRELDIMALLDVETQRLTVERGQIVRRPNREAKLGLALEFSSTIMVPAGDSFVPMFTTDSVQVFLAKPRAKELINQLAEAIYSINPELSPQKKIQVANALKG